MALSKVDLANQVENDLPQNLIANNVNFRNIIINGDMQYLLKEELPSSGNTTDVIQLDRMTVGISSSGTYTVSQDTDVPTGA